MNGLHETTFRLIDALEREGVPYALMGGLALGVHAIPTPTYDLDLTVAPEDAGRVLRACASAGFEVPPEHDKGLRNSIQGMEKVRVVWRSGASPPLDVDIFLVTTAFQRASFARRQRAGLRGREVWLFTPEDLLLFKLMAWRPKDRSAIQNLLVTNPPMDRAYLEEWARRLSVADRLAEAWREAEAFWSGEGRQA